MLAISPRRSCSARRWAVSACCFSSRRRLTCRVSSSMFRSGVGRRRRRLASASSISRSALAVSLRLRRSQKYSAPKTTAARTASQTILLPPYLISIRRKTAQPARQNTRLYAAPLTHALAIWGPKSIMVQALLSCTEISHTFIWPKIE